MMKQYHDLSKWNSKMNVSYPAEYEVGDIVFT